MDAIQLIAWGVVVLIAIGVDYVLIKGYKDQKKGKTDTFKNVPVIGAFTVLDWWLPKTPRQKNLIVNKLLIFLYTCLAFFMGSGWGWSMLFVIAVAVMFEIQFFDENDL